MNGLFLTDRETATILAALRMWQSEIEAEGAGFTYGDISTDCGRLDPMTTGEIDLLARKINGGGR